MQGIFSALNPCSAYSAWGTGLLCTDRPPKTNPVSAGKRLRCPGRGRVSGAAAVWASARPTNSSISTPYQKDASLQRFASYSMRRCWPGVLVRWTKLCHLSEAGIGRVMIVGGLQSSTSTLSVHLPFTSSSSLNICRLSREQTRRYEAIPAFLGRAAQLCSRHYRTIICVQCYYRMC
jgi:hypothetical protein